MARVVTVGASNNPNDKYPKFIEKTEYLMKVIAVSEFEKDNYDRTGKETNLKWKLECIDSQQPAYIGKTAIYFSQSYPTKDMRNKLTQLILATISNNPLVDDQSLDLDTVVGHSVACTFIAKQSGDRTFENVVTLQRPGSFSSNAPVQQPPQPSSGVNLPEGWQQQIDSQTNNPIYLPPGSQQWQFEPPPQAPAPPQPTPAPAQAPMPAPQTSALTTPMPVPQQAPPPPAPAAPPPPQAVQAPSSAPPAPAGSFGWPEGK